MTVHRSFESENSVMSKKDALDFLCNRLYDKFEDLHSSDIEDIEIYEDYNGLDCLTVNLKLKTDFSVDYQGWNGDCHLDLSENTINVCARSFNENIKISTDAFLLPKTLCIVSSMLKLADTERTSNIGWSSTDEIYETFCNSSKTFSRPYKFDEVFKELPCEIDISPKDFTEDKLERYASDFITLFKNSSKSFQEGWKAFNDIAQKYLNMHNDMDNFIHDNSKLNLKV